jgi:hypothetical protein
MLIHNQTIASISNFHLLYVESQRTRAEATHEEQTCFVRCSCLLVRVSML